jgi:hypothetical protein
VDPITEVLGSIDKFCAGLRDLVSARGSDKSLVHRNVAAYTAFKRNIRVTVPDFRPFEDVGEYLNPEIVDNRVNVKDWVQGKTYGLYDVRSIIKRYVLRARMVLPVLMFCCHLN